MVSDDNVSAALNYLAQDPHPIAVAKYELTMAENRCKELYAQLFLQGSGTIDARKAAVESNLLLVEARAKEADCVLELERHKARTNAATMLLEVWRSENANARAAERIR